MGIVLWEILAKKRLMAGENAANTLHRLMNEPIIPLSRAVPGIDPQLEAITMRALEKEPEKRFASAREMRDALEQYLVDAGHAMRQDEVGRRVGEMFEKTRKDVQGEVQRYMAALSSPAYSSSMSNPRVQAMSISSIDEIEHAGGNVNAQLLNLQDGAPSVISAPGAASRTSSGSLSRSSPGSLSRTSGSLAQTASSSGHQAAIAPAQTEDTKRKRTLLVFLALFALFALAGVISIVMVLRGRDEVAETPREGSSIANAGSATAPVNSAGTPSLVASTQPAPIASVATPAPSATPAPPASPTQPATVAATPPRGSRGRPAPSPKPAPPPPKSPPPAAAPSDGPPGFLTLDTYPWTRVSEGGRPLGSTPIVHLSLSPGTHVLLLENPDLGIKQGYTVTIKSGESVSRRLGLR
jgi:serine/threonine-protein kinase